MNKTDHVMAEKNENNKDSQKGQVTPEIKKPFGGFLNKSSGIIFKKEYQ
jgi:hypothetical protein